MAFNNTNSDILVAGALAAFTVDLLVYPLDTIKTRLQSPDYKRLFTHAPTNSVNRSLFRGLYQGIGSVVIATVPSCTIGIAISHSPLRLPFVASWAVTFLPEWRLTPFSRSILHHLRDNKDVPPQC